LVIINNATINMGVLSLKMSDMNVKEVLFEDKNQQEGYR
jgi:hypothetical protein